MRRTRATYAATANKTVECNAKLGRIRCRSTRSSFLMVRTVSYQFSAYASRRTSFGEPAVCSSLLKDVSMQLSYTVIKLPFSLRTRVMLSAKVMRQLGPRGKRPEIRFPWRHVPRCKLFFSPPVTFYQKVMTSKHTHPLFPAPALHTQHPQFTLSCVLLSYHSK